MPVSYSEYKGNKMISLMRKPKEDGTEDKFPFTFGSAKAKLIVENYPAIKAFAGGDEMPEPKPSTKVKTKKKAKKPATV